MPISADRLTAGLLPALALLLAGCASMPAKPSGADPVTTALEPIEVPDIQRPQGENADWWFRHGAAEAARLSRQARADDGRARNVIVFLGDGMSITTIAAAHVRAGQLRGVDGESYKLSFEKFPFTALSRTYSTDTQVADSAATMTAIMTGVKTRSGMLSEGQHVDATSCQSIRSHRLVTMLELAEQAGMASGIVSTARITHATPGATYGHVPERGWESDARMPAAIKAAGCRDLAAQFVGFDVGDGIEVAMGGGRRGFLPVGAVSPEDASDHGRRKDGRNLVAEWQARYPHGAYVWNNKQLAALDLAATPRLLGLFEGSHLSFEHDRPHDAGGEPSLAEMTRAAIEVLEGDPDGYFLMVEGGRIDHALHGGNAFRALGETIAFADAVQAAVDATNHDETLIVVTSDHSHTLTMAGYAVRGNPILGLVRVPDDEGGTELAHDALGLPYTSLGFANGPGYQGATDTQPAGPKHAPHYYDEVHGITAGRADLGAVNTTAPNYLQEATMPLHSETHGGEDVAVFARGPGAPAFHGEIEENTIFHLIVQHAPALRRALCDLGSCNADGVPVDRPDWSTLGAWAAGTM